MAKRLLVEGLDWGITHQDLEEIFSPFGALNEAVVVEHWETGRSRGFGYVTFEVSSDAETALSSLNGQLLSGKILRVMLAPDQVPSRPSTQAGAYRSVDYDDKDLNQKPRLTRGIYRSADYGYAKTPSRKLSEPPESASKSRSEAPKKAHPSSEASAEDKTLETPSRKDPEEADASPKMSQKGTQTKGKDAKRTPFG